MKNLTPKKTFAVAAFSGAIITAIVANSATTHPEMVDPLRLLGMGLTATTVFLAKD